MGSPSGKTQAPASSTLPCVTLPSGHVVVAGDCLSVMEAQDPVVFQPRLTPLRPVALPSDTYVLVLSDVVPAALVLAGMFSGALP